MLIAFRSHPNSSNCRCDSIETAFTLRNQLQLLIDRPENQRKFAEIEARLAAKGLISQQQLLNNNHHQAKPIKTNQITNGKADYAPAGKHQAPAKHSIHQAQLVYSQHGQHGSANRSKRNTLTSDGRSAEDEYNQSDGYSPTIRSEPDGQPSLNKSLAESKSSSGNSSGSSPPPQAPNPVVVEMYENLAAELKAKLGNPSIGPILLPPKDYDTVCRSQGRLVELDKRACTNSLVVGVGKSKKAKEGEKPTKKQDNLILNTNEKAGNVKDGASALPKEAVSKDAPKEAPKVPTKEAKNEAKTKEPVASKKSDPATESKSTDKPLEANKIKKLSPEELIEQKKRLDHQQIREQQKQYEQKLKNLQRKQELYEQQQLLIEQQKQVRRELSQQHKPNSKAAGSKEPIKSAKSANEERLSSSSKQPTNASPETSAVIHSGGIKQIGSSLASKIKQSLIGSNKEKLQPQLICHKTIHDSLQSLNKLTKSDLLLSNDKLKSKNNLKQIDNLSKANEARPVKERSANASNAKSSTLNTSMSNSSSNISRDLNTMNSRSDSSNVSKSISSGIGSAGNLNTKKSRAASNYDDPPYLSTDEELEDELLIHDLSECVDEYMPDFAFNQYLNDEEDEIIDDLDLDDEECGNNRVVRRMAIREKLLLLEKNANPEKKKSEFGSTGERQMTSSEDDAEINSICYDENLVITKINTAKRIKKPSTKSIKLDQFNQKIVDNVKNAKNITKHSGAKHETKNADAAGHSAKLPTKAVGSVQPCSANPVKRSETYYEMNSGQKKLFQYNNYYFPHTNKSPIDRSALHQPKLFYFPNPEFKAAQQQQLIGSPGQQPPQLMKYHLGRQQQAPIRRQKSTPNVNAKFSYHPMLINGHMNSSVEKLMAGDDHLMNRKIVNLDKYAVTPVNLAAHQRPISMVNMMQPEHFRMPPHPADFKRVPIYY